MHRVRPFIKDGTTVAPEGYVLREDGLCDPIDPNAPLPAGVALITPPPSTDVVRPRIIDGRVTAPPGYVLKDDGLCYKTTPVEARA